MLRRADVQLYHPLWTVAGVVVLAFMIHDVIITTLHRGGGPITRVITGPLWRVLMRTRIRGLASHRALSLAGIALMLFTVALWIVLLWTGWTLVFLGDAHAVHAEADNLPAELVDRVYFAGFTIFTLGIGDFVPGDAVYEILTAVASLSGFFMITFAVTYLMPVAQAAASKRALADRVATLGRDPGAMLAHAWDGTGLATLEDAVTDAIEGLAQARQDHLAYPVLHFFHSAQREQSLAVCVARLDEALWLARLGSDRPLLRDAVCGRWHEMVERLVDTMGIEDDEQREVPPLPSPTRAREAGVPLVDDDELWRRLRRADRERRRTLELVRAHGWEWDAVLGIRRDGKGRGKQRDERREERRDLDEQPTG